MDENKLFKWLTQLIHSESDFQEIKGIVIDCANWTQLKRRIEPLLEERGDENKLFKWLTQLIHSESDFQEIKGIVIDCANWTQLKRRIEPLLEERGIDA